MPIISLILRMLGCFSHFWIAQKTGSVILGLVILSPRLLSMLRLGTILLKNVLNVSASSTLFVIFLLLSFNVMHSLWKAFLEKRGLSKIFQNFLLSVTILLFKLPKQPLVFTQNTHVEISLFIIETCGFVRSFT